MVPTKRGQLPERPRGGKELPGHGTVGGNDGRDTDPRNHLNENRTDSNTGKADARSRIANAGASHRHRLAERSASAHPQGWSSGSGWPDGGRVRGKSGEQSSVAARPRQVG